MLLEILQNVNLLDILVFLLLLRTISISLQKGFTIEIFKLLGYVFATYLALHYYTICSDLARETFGVREAPVEFLDFFCFVALACAGYNFFVLVRLAVIRKKPDEEAMTAWNRWGGVVVGSIRGIVMSGLIIFGLVASTMTYFKTQVNGSLLGKGLFDVSPAVYSWIWDNVTSTVSRNEKVNATVKEVQKTLSQKDRTQGAEDESQ